RSKGACNPYATAVMASHWRKWGIVRAIRRRKGGGSTAAAPAYSGVYCRDGGDHERRRVQRQHSQIPQDARGERPARNRKGGPPGLGGRQAQGQREVSRQGHGHARRYRLLTRDQGRDRAGVSGGINGLCLRAARGHQPRVPPLALIGPAPFSSSLWRNWRRYSGVARSSETITAPSPSSRSFTTGVFIAWTAASLSFLTTSSGAPFGRKIAFQVEAPRVGVPCSRPVGTLGSARERSCVMSAIGCTVPPSICGLAVLTISHR